MTNTVLIVDDSLTVRMDLAEAFESADFTTLPCGTAAEARKLLAGAAIDVVILDVLLPDGDGIELLKLVRTSPSATAVVLMLSTEAEIKDRIKGLQTGADEFVGKPYDTSYVVTKARELLRSRCTGEATDRATVLIIDDSLTFREELRQACETAGYRVLVAASGEEGLQVAAAHRPNAIVVDGQLPGIDGATVIRQMRIDAALRSVPCLLLTASQDLDVELKALDAGADAFVRKEDDVELILAKLSVLLRRTAAGPVDKMTSLLSPKKILAVDDSNTQLQELGSALLDEGYDVILAHSGEEALELLAVQSVDCILLDLLMPGLGGQETCHRIKSTPIMRDIPLIVLTALEDRQSLLDGLGAGADDYIQKSSGFDVLKARVRAQIRRKQFEDENRHIREELLLTEMKVAEARAARELAEARAVLVEELQVKNNELENSADALTEMNLQLRHEINERLKTEEQLRQSQKMESIGQLTGGIAHDFNNLLTSVIGSIDLVMRKNTDPNVTRLLTNATKAAERGARLTSQLLAFGRRQILTIVALNLNELVLGLKSMLGATLTPLFTIELSLDDELWPALGDATQLELAIINLAVNARDAMIGGGTLSIQTRNLGPNDPGYPDDLKPENIECVVLSVTDTGTGMPEEIKARAFEPFFTTKEVGKGTGLGLSMVYGLAKQLGGTARITSKLDRGTTVTIYLPRNLASSTPVLGPEERHLRPWLTPIHDRDSNGAASEAMVGFQSSDSGQVEGGPAGSGSGTPR